MSKELTPEEIESLRRAEQGYRERAAAAHDSAKPLGDPNSLEAILARLAARAAELAPETLVCAGCGVPSGDRMCPACSAKRDAEALERRLTQSIPARFRWAKLDAPELAHRLRRRAALEEAVAALQEPLVVLTGTAGSGKTSLACAMLRAWNARRPYDVGRFESAWRLAMSRARHPLGEDEPEEVRRAMSCSLLVLDDLGSERQMHNSAVPDVVFDRHDTERPMWITTGLTTKQVIERYGEGFARRVFEGARIVDLEGAR